MNAEPEWISEKEILQVSGLKGSDARRARSGMYRKGCDWERRARGAVYWRKNAAQRLFEELGVTTALLEQKSPAESKPAQDSGIPAVELEVWRGPAEGIANRVMVEAHLLGHRPRSQADILRVMVRDNRTLRAGHRIWATQWKDDLYLLAPPPKPREMLAKEVGNGVA